MKIPSDSRFVDLTNKVFGKLTVLEYSGKHKNGYSLWKCQCECGRIEENVIYGNLTTKGKDKCKWCPKERKAYKKREEIEPGSILEQPTPKDPRFKNLKGQKFGKLTVEYYAGKKDKKYSLWYCKCDCGNYKYIVGSSLTNGNTISCNCVNYNLGDTRICSDCGKEYPSTSEYFPVNKQNKSKGIRGVCIDCYNKRQRDYSETWRYDLRLEVLSHYGNGLLKCVCCGEDREEVLTIDHVNTDGKEHREETRSHVYEDLKRQEFPDGYLTLCRNCNSSLYHYCYCPHCPENKREIIKNIKHPKPFIEGLDDSTFKECFKCGEILPVNENYFYKHFRMGDGFLNKCKKCAREDVKEQSKINQEDLRIEILYKISNVDVKCKQCGERYLEFLNIDHVNNDGYIERKENGRSNLYRKILKNEYPENYFQILCSNCNWLKYITYKKINKNNPI